MPSTLITRRAMTSLDCTEIELQQSQQHIMQEPIAMKLMLESTAYTWREAFGRIIAISGVHRRSEHVGAGWILRSKWPTRQMRALLRGLWQTMQESGFIRIEATVVEGGLRAAQFCSMLSMVNETPNGMPNYGGPGVTHHLWAWTPGGRQNG